MKTLHPPLAVLESELFSPSIELLERWRLGMDISESQQRALDVHPKALTYKAEMEAEAFATLEDAVSIDDADIPPMPPELLAAIRGRIAAREATFSHFPTPGQIVGIEEVIGPEGLLPVDLPRPIAVLINKPTMTANVWQGWVVGEEVDYAADLDVLIGPEDEPCDPIVRTVQLWNPVHVYLLSSSGVLGEFSQERLATIRRLDAEFFVTPRPTALARPGKTILQTLSNGDKIRTGTPLGGIEDPRHRYQMLYHTYAEAVREPARLAHAQLTWVEQLMKSLESAVADLGDTLGRALTLEPQPVYAMGDETTEWWRLGDWLELQIQEEDAEPSTFRLRIRNLGATNCRVQLLCKGQMRFQDYVAAGKDLQLVPITIAPDTELVFANKEGTTFRWMLPI